jgi:hypothetical protein
VSRNDALVGDCGFTGGVAAAWGMLLLGEEEQSGKPLDFAALVVVGRKLDLPSSFSLSSTVARLLSSNVERLDFPRELPDSLSVSCAPKSSEEISTVFSDDASSCMISFCFTCKEEVLA